MEDTPSAASNEYKKGETYSHRTGSYEYKEKTDKGFEFFNLRTGVTTIFPTDPNMMKIKTANAKTASRRAVGVGGRRRKTRRRRSTLGRR